MSTPTRYESRAANDARDMSYGTEDYWQYLDDAARDNRDYFRRHPELGIDPESMMTRTLSEALAGNDGP